MPGGKKFAFRSFGSWSHPNVSGGSAASLLRFTVRSTGALGCANPDEVTMPRFDFALFWVFVAALVWAITASSIFWVVATYVVCAGVAWRRYHLQRPRAMTPPVLHHRWSVLLWLAISLVAVKGYFQLLKDPERFIVLYGVSLPGRLLPDPQFEYLASWDAALAFARKEAAESGQDVEVYDCARLLKYRTSPSGKIESGRWTRSEQLHC